MFPAILGIGQICSWGTLFYSFPLIVIEMEKSLGWSKADLYAGATLGLIATAFMSYPVGVGIDRGFGKWIMSAASFLAALLLAWWSVTQSMPSYYIICTLLGALQACVFYEAAFAVLARRVGAANARPGLTQITLWAGFASTVFVPVTGTLIALFEWRTTLLILGLFNLVYGMIYLKVLDPAKDHDHAQDVCAKAEQIKRNKEIVRNNLRSAPFWFLLVSLTAFAGAFSGFTYHLYPILQGKGLSDGDVIFAISLLGPAQVAGRFVISLFARDMPLRLLGSVMVGMLPITFALLYPLQLGIGYVVAVICLYGLVNGIFTIVRSFAVPDMLSPHAYGALNGLITLTANLARAITPLAAAWIWQINDSYQPVILAIISLSLASMLTFWAAAWTSRPSARSISR